MALKYQKYIDLPDGKMIGIHIIEPTENVHTITVAELTKHSLVTTGDAVKQVANYNQTLLATAPATASLYSFTLTTTAAERATLENSEIVVVTNHRIRQGNHLYEADPGY